MEYKKSFCRQCKKEIIVPNIRSNGYLCEDCKKENAKNKKKRENLRYRIICPPRKCKACGGYIFYDWRSDIIARRGRPLNFCSETCAKKYAANYLRTEGKNKTKRLKCLRCGKENEVLINHSNTYICEACRKKLKEEKNPKKYKYSENCVLGNFERSWAYKTKSSNIKKLGFDFEGNFEEEFFKVRNLLYSIYYDQKKSILEMVDLFNFKSSITPQNMLRLFGFNKFRGVKEGIVNSYVQGRSSLTIPNDNYQFKHGWIDTQFGKFYYRSSYELNLIKFLDSKGIRFTCNEFKINYVSSIDNLIHRGYPDFYLLDYNLIIETKSKKFFDDQDLRDRYREIKKEGLDYIIIEFEKKIEILLEFIEINKKEEIYELLGVI